MRAVQVVKAEADMAVARAGQVVVVVRVVKVGHREPVASRVVKK